LSIYQGKIKSEGGGLAVTKKQFFLPKANCLSYVMTILCDFLL